MQKLKLIFEKMNFTSVKTVDNIEWTANGRIENKYKKNKRDGP